MVVFNGSSRLDTNEREDLDKGKGTPEQLLLYLPSWIANVSNGWLLFSRLSQSHAKVGCHVTIIECLVLRREGALSAFGPAARDNISYLNAGFRWINDTAYGQVSVYMWILIRFSVVC
jgi:hypothetical protein